MSVDLGERLRRVLGTTRPERDGRPDGAASPSAMAAVRTRDIADLVPGEVLTGAHGPCFLAERRYPLDHCHGDEPLSGFFTVSDQGLGCLARLAQPLGVDREAVLFLDTETTGLSGGTGTFVFLVGVAYFRDDWLVVRQYFMRHHAEEPAMLAALAGLLGGFEAVVTFNGKSFDVPLLTTRYTANRQPCSLRSAIHLDLLHPARRFWRDRLEACNLGTLEQAILGHTRAGDIPSWMIPELYFQYVRGGGPEPIAQVFEHNVHDVLSLVALTCRLGRLLEAPAAGGSSTADIRDLFAAARLYDDLGLSEEASLRYEQALAAGRDVAVRAQVAGRLAALCKRVGRHARAIQLWQRLASLGLSGSEPHVELAKHYEHRLRDYDAALGAVEQALTVVELRELRRLPGASQERAELEHRRARLLEKRRRAAGGLPVVVLS